MGTMDQMLFDNRDIANRYSNQVTSDPYVFSRAQPPSTHDSDRANPFGRRVFLESPSLDNREAEEDIYR